MKKILGLTIAALMVMGLVGGGTWAYFTDTETSTGNTFAAGTLDLEVDSENPWTSTPISILDIAPGANSGNVTITCENVGNLEGDLFLKISSVATTGGTSIYPSGTPVASSEPEWTIGGGASYVEVKDIDTKLTLNCIADSVATTGIDSTLLSAMPSTWTKIKENLASGSIDLVMSADLASTTDNNYQGDVCTFTIELYLAQDGQTPP